MTKYEQAILIDIINEEINSYIDSGYPRNDEYILTLEKIKNELRRINI